MEKKGNFSVWALQEVKIPLANWIIPLWKVVLNTHVHIHSMTFPDMASPAFGAPVMNDYISILCGGLNPTILRQVNSLTAWFPQWELHLILVWSKDSVPSSRNLTLVSWSQAGWLFCVPMELYAHLQAMNLHILLWSSTYGSPLWTEILSLHLMHSSNSITGSALYNNTCSVNGIDWSNITVWSFTHIILLNLKNNIKRIQRSRHCQLHKANSGWNQNSNLDLRTQAQSTEFDSPQQCRSLLLSLSDLLEMVVTILYESDQHLASWVWDKAKTAQWNLVIFTSRPTVDCV